MATLLLLLSTLACALITGLFYGYSCSVNPGLARLPDASYLAAMQSINQAILNPYFFASFMGALVLLPSSTFMHQQEPARFYLLLAASIIYIVGVFGVTLFGNVPLNDSLASFDLTSSSAEVMHTFRIKFKEQWNQWHMVRTFASLIAFVLLIIACLNPSKNL